MERAKDSSMDMQRYVDSFNAEMAAKRAAEAAEPKSLNLGELKLQESDEAPLELDNDADWWKKGASSKQPPKSGGLKRAA